MIILRFVFVMATLWALALPVRAETMRMAVTTSFHNSGLSEVLLPAIKRDTGITVQLIVVGTGQALKLGRAGDVDAVLVHSRKAEDAFVAEGHGTHRREIMYNDFVVIGPKSDPAELSSATTAKEAFQRLAVSVALFISRGDDSGTHVRERALWENAGVEPASANYRSVGAGMGAALNISSAMNAHTLSDRASWLNFANKGDLTILFEGDKALFNQYAYLPVNPAQHPHVKHKTAQLLEAWLTGKTGQQAISDYRLSGQQLFMPNAKALQN